ncbi:MAG: BCCT family transporter [Coxiellaceae bacterium]|nr:BCCT family transporter [Coxiellaceae bacterium]
MKTRKTYRWSSIIILPFALLLLIGFFTHFTDHVFYPYIGVNWLCLLLAAFYILGPWGKLRLDDADNPGKKYSLPRWLGLIFLLQLSMLMVYVGIYALCFNLLPVNNGAVSLTNTLATVWQQWIIYPWGIVAMLAVSLALNCYIQKEDAFISNVLAPLLKNKHDSLVTHISQLCIRNATLAGLSITFGFYLMIVAVLLTHNHTAMIPQGQKTSAFITALVMAVFGFLPFVKHGIAKLMRRQIPSILGICAIIVIGALIFLLLCVIFSTINVASNASGKPLYYDTLLKLGHKNVWMLLTVNWWLAFTPICGIIIGYISKGYTIRSCLIATLIGPALISFAPHFHYWMPHWLLIMFILVGFIIFFGILTQKNIRSMLVIGYIPKGGKYKARDYHFFFRRVFRFSGFTIYFYLPIGVMYLALASYVTGIFSCVVLGLVAISFVVALAKRDFGNMPDNT